MGIIADFGLLEWTFVGLLAGLTAVVTLVAAYVIAQLFRNPTRRRTG